MSKPAPIFRPPMSRCERCGRFTKRGLWAFIHHETYDCPGKFESEPPGLPVPEITDRFVPLSIEGQNALDDACREYYENY